VKKPQEDLNLGPRGRQNARGGKTRPAKEKEGATHKKNGEENLLARRVLLLTRGSRFFKENRCGEETLEAHEGGKNA